MTTKSQLKPRPVRKTRKKMTEQTYPVKKNEVEIPKVILPKPEDDIIPFNSYVQDAKNRWKIHQYEIKELSKDVQWLYNKAKPYVDKVVTRLSPEAS
jgi:hypothetical protein